MFGVPARTEFDLNFRLLGIPTRITPFFWVAAAFLGANLGSGIAFTLWILAVLVSIMIHEFGHALTARYFREDPEVILYEMGGLCVYQPSHSARSPWQRFIVLLMGPGAGFLLVGLILLVTTFVLRLPIADVWHTRVLVGGNLAITRFVYFLFEINIAWGLMNLLPIYPLDGGQMSSIIFTHFNRRNGMRWSLVLSLVCGGLAVIYVLSKSWGADQSQATNYLPALLFGLLAFRSYQMLQTLHYQNRYGDSFEQDDDWWKR